MIDIVTWRARIGSFNFSTGGPRPRAGKHSRPSNRKWSLTVIILLSMLTSSASHTFGTGSAAPPDHCCDTTFPHDVALASFPPPPPGVLNEDITGYNLTCPHVTSNLDSTLTSSATTITITSGITPVSNYSCTQIAVNMNGSSPSTCSFEMVQDALSDTLHHFSVTPTMTSIMFSWQSPAWPNGIITGCSLIVQQRTSQLWLSNMSYFKCGLQPGQQVNASISASTGEEPHENVSAVTTREDCTSVDNLMAVGTSDSTLISWNPPINHHGFITGYSVIVENSVTSDLPLCHTESTTATVPSPSAAVPYYIPATLLDICNCSVNSSSIINFTSKLAPSVAPIIDPILHPQTMSLHPLTLEETHGVYHHQVPLTPVTDSRKQTVIHTESVPSTQSSFPVHKLGPHVSYSAGLGTVNMDLTTGPQLTVPPPQIIADDNIAVYDMFHSHFDQLMINVVLWRATIGLFNLSTSGPSRKKGKVQQPSSAGEWSLLLALGTSTVEVLTVTIILMLLMLSGDVETNPGPGARPTMDELISIKKINCSGETLRVIDWITTHSHAKCNDFAHILLKDEVVVRKQRKDNEEDDDFVRAVLREWLSIPDDSANKAAPRTWKALAVCVREAGLDGALAKAIRDNCPQDQPVPRPIPAPASTHHPPGLQRYIDSLKHRYIHKSPLLKESTLSVRPKEYIHLNLVSSKEEVEEEELKKECLMLQLHGDVTGMKKKKRPMEMDKVGKGEDQSVIQHILVEGAPGIGKTMFAWELCRQWAQHEMLQDRAIVLMLQLRSTAVRCAKSLSDLFHHDNDDIKTEVLKHITSLDGKGVFLIFEGYDELAEDQKAENSILKKLLTGECLPESTIMVTSRPLASHSLCPEFRESLDQHIEIVGFTADDIKSYVETACKKQPAILLEDLKSYVSSNPFVASVMFIPLQCALLTALYIQNWRRKGKAYAPTTLTQLYTDLLLSLLMRYISDHPEVYKGEKRAITKFSDLPTDIQEKVWKLSQLAAEGLKERKYIFDNVPCDHMGLMQGAEEELVLGSSVSYCFLHLTLQEYLAALYWSKLGSGEVARVVSESDIFPLTTLVSEGIGQMSGFHWPALFFLAGLTKLQSIPLKILKSSLTAGERPDKDDHEDSKELLATLYSMISEARECNPNFFQLLFEAHSRDLVSQIFAGEMVAPEINTPLESFVTAWCIANSDATSRWIPAFENTLFLQQLHQHVTRLDCSLTGHEHGKIWGLNQNNIEKDGSLSEILAALTNLNPCTHHTKMLVLSGELSTEPKEFVTILPSMLPCLEILGANITPGDLTHWLSVFSRLHELASLKSIIVSQPTRGRFKEVSLPPQHYPSLVELALEVSILFPTLVSRNINTIRSLGLVCPLASADFSDLCNGLCQTTTLKMLALDGIEMETTGAKELAAAIKQNRSLKKVIVDDDTIDDEGITILRAVLENHSTVEKYEVNGETNSDSET